MRAKVSGIIAAFVIGAIAFVALPSSTKVFASPPPPWECFPVVGGVFVDIAVWSSEQDRDSVCFDFQWAVNNSTTLTNRITASGGQHNYSLIINVYRDVDFVSIAHTPPNADGTCCKGMIMIDLGDIEAIRNVDYFPDGTEEQVNDIADGFRIAVIAHEIEHTTGSVDPDDCGEIPGPVGPTGPAVDTENDVLSDLAYDYERLNYCWFNDNGPTEDTPEDCDDDEGGIIFWSFPDSELVILESISSGYDDASRSYLEYPDQPQACAPPSAVGGIAELPDTHGIELEGPGASDTAATDNSGTSTWPGCRSSSRCGVPRT